MEGENGLRERIARHDVEIEYIKQQLNMLQELRRDVSDLRTEIARMREDIENLRAELNKRNNSYRWLTMALISLASSFVAIALALLKSLI